MNGDNLVDGRDIQGFVNCFQSGSVVGSCVQSVYNADGVVDQADVEMLLNELMAAGQ